MMGGPALSTVFGLFTFLHGVNTALVQQKHYLSKRDVVPNMLYDLNTISTCSFWYDNYEGRSCTTVRDLMFNISPEDFTRWNPSVTLDCGNWQELSYCVRVNSEETSTSSSTIVTSTTTSTTTSVAATPTLTGWNSLGCYVDSNTLSEHNSDADGSQLTIDKCETSCWSEDFMYAGVKAGTECWCGSYVGNGWTNDQSDCNLSCSGDSSQSCGGADVFNIFEAQTQDTLPPAATTFIPTTTTTASTSSTTSTSTTKTSTATATATWQAVGCYKDLYPANDRTLANNLDVSDTSLTIEGCQSTCKKAGYIYAGVENGRECWCGNEIQSPSTNVPVAEGDCDTVCTGESTELCGSGAHAYLYKYVVPSVSWVYIGCYSDEGDTPTLLNSVTVVGGATNNTRQNCIDSCNNGGYSYAGTKDASQCWCDNTINGILSSDGTASCNLTCPGKSDETCGGVSQLDVFISSSAL